jgi:non-ribosomal peptide synthetase component F/thioesterase domain-containing protein
VSRLTLEYQLDVFAEARIAALAAAYQQILQRVLRTPLQLARVDELIAPAHAEAKARRPARRRATCTPIDVLLTDALLTLAGRTAVIDDEGALTWDEFAALTAAYARVLNTSTIRRALIVGRPGRQLQAFLAACFLTRTTYLALETGTPTQRVQEVIEHAGPDLVVATDAAAVMGIHARLLEEISIDPAAVDWRAFRSVKSHEENPIGWILYSSGTTGGPKGICVASHTAAQYLESILSALRLERGLRVVQQFSPSFDGYLEEVLLAWALQGTSVVVDRYTLLDEHKASAFLARHRPDVLSASPALFSAWNRWPDLAPLPRVCVSGGDFLALGDINRLLERTQVWNSYGPTETCIAVSMVNCARVAPGAAPPIGEPFDHVALAVVDADGRELPPGRWGELLIHGDFEHHAYLNDPVLTARKFGRDARGTDRGTFFRTGDLAMLDQQGMFHLKGRMDDSCKVRGNFIALGELENRAGQYPGVQAAGASVAFAGSPEACLVLAFEGNAIVPSGLQQSLARHYPRSHLPAAIFRVERLPRTQAGKLDREQVVALFQRWKQQADDSLQEHALAEGLQELIACWRDCLGFNGALTLDSDFFVVSGSSLSAVRLASQLQTRFGVAVTPVDIFRNATVGAQWALIKARQGERGTSDGLLQERFLNVDEPGTPHLVLLPPALGGLLELTALAANLNGHVTISVLTVEPSAVAALTEEEFGTMLLHALWACVERHGRHSTRPLWLGGYSLGAEILAALLAQQPALLKNFQKLVLLDPNLRTEVFAGDALYTEFVDFFRSFIHRTDSGAAIGQDTDVEILRRDFPSIYREWRYYELQHRLLGSVTLYERITTLPLVSFPLLLFFSDDADSESIEALQQRLECGAVLHRRRGDHFTFVGGLGPADFSDAGVPGRDVLSEPSPAWPVSGPASGESPLGESSPRKSSPRKSSPRKSSMEEE